VSSLSKASKILGMIEDLQALKVIKTTKKASYYIDKYKYQKEVLREDDKYKYQKEVLKEVLKEDEFRYSMDVSLSDLVVKDNKVLIPSSVEPFYYNTDCDLLPFEIGDIVELSFQDHRLVNKKYRGKKVQFVVNNFFEYGWSIKTKRLALTPTAGKWKLKDVVILDDINRFDYLMEDLFPCNRRPYAGYSKKEVTIDKVGVAKKIPEYKDAVDFESLLEIKDDDYIIGYTTDPDIPRYVDKGPDWNNRKIITSADVKIGIRLLKDDLENINKNTEALMANLDDIELRLKSYKDFKYEEILKKQLKLI